jgi:predicted RNA polymerase sigma factor
MTTLDLIIMLTHACCRAAQSEEVTLNYVLVLAKCQGESMTLTGIETVRARLILSSAGKTKHSASVSENISLVV